MKAMILEKVVDLSQNQHPLVPVFCPEPILASGELLIKVTACGVCHTELDEIEGRTPPSFFPMILGHQVVGNIIKTSSESHFAIGERVGVAWIFSACEKCEYCLSDNENLCPHFKATGRDAFGGYAELMKAPENFVFRIPDKFSDSEAAPLLCAGAIGYRSIKLTGLKNGQYLGLTGFGASAHLVLKLVKFQYPDSPIFVFARSEQEREFALELGACWAGDSTDTPPAQMHAIIDTTPVWKPVIEALRNLRPGGRLVINAIRKEEIDKDYFLKLDYPIHLWLEKEIKSVANVARSDVRHFLDLAAEIPIKPEVQEYPLEAANQALMELKERKIRGAKVLRID
ncbi:zinc-dependent alcohol dehydrogenase family protein [candidate division KSB1 bacterium]|nr:zinc-dependent alcohol dehydrogenase family protein [candidate division KSB1 bacterium]